MGAAFSSPEMTVRPRERGRHVYQRWQQTRQDGRGDLLSVGSRSKRMSATLSPPPPPSSAQAAGRAWHLRRRHHRRRHGDSEDGRGIFATGATGEDSETDRTWAARSPPSAAETTQDGCGDLLSVGSRSKRMSATLSPPPPSSAEAARRAWHFRRRRHRRRQGDREDGRGTFTTVATGEDSET